MDFFLIIMVFLSSLLFYWVILKAFTKNEKVLEKRINRYLFQQVEQEDKKTPRKKLTFDLSYTKQKVRKKFLTKDRNAKIQTLINRAGVPLKPEEYIMFQWISTALTAGLLYLIVDSIFILPVGAIAGFILPKHVLIIKQKQRLKAFNNGLPEMLSSVIGGLRAGFSFPQALKSYMGEAQEPMKEEINTVLREMQYGTSVEEALNNLKDRMPSDDLDIMIQAIVIQRQVGGNLATVLEKIVDTIRERIKIHGQIKTLTAQGRISGTVVGLLPVFLGVFLFMIQPDYIGTLFTNIIGIVLIVIGSISTTIGFLLIRKITTIEV
ncbi:type II secretion system F family protein [Radiobacillus sp. PE A8.2]|uniref:type II secretion system F family protein n=1 Tax=Radiobacillus sp. PE A8.2 TaxID=3380349 RepID=UPI00388F25CE